MYAIIEQGGKQYRVAEGDLVVLDHMGGDEGDKVSFDKVLMIGGKAVKVGAPTVKGAKVTGKLVEHTKGKKVLTFKYRPTRRMRRRVGFRHTHTIVEITGIKG